MGSNPITGTNKKVYRMTYSAGIIIWRKDKDRVRFFVGTPGGPAWGNRECWNFPKGTMEEGESPFQTAVREFSEETGVLPSSINVNDYVYEGLIKQRKDKAVYVFSKEQGDEVLDENCKSNTFVWTDGKEYPEIGRYMWLTVDEIEKRGGVKAYYEVFKAIENKTKLSFPSAFYGGKGLQIG